MRYCFKEILEKKGMTCSYISQKVDYEIAKTSMSRMLNLSNVLQFVIHNKIK